MKIGIAYGNYRIWFLVVFTSFSVFNHECVTSSKFLDYVYIFLSVYVWMCVSLLQFIVPSQKNAATALLQFIHFILKATNIFGVQ